ncbi:hypothetical protein [Candidatus Halocynthiibacter alkanivorans]|uniref:hypothetical protein n=1 Tax=Candidatus Halocynthiibacter alkanivorans TaxID=2267619 RepID=UPI000DF29E6E|nr:hypothetical protein [Candidatus Halocynthiibacter alkanivorans]
MKKVLTAAAALAVGATGAYAGGIERTTQSVGVLFEEGNYAEFSFASVSPDVSGTSTVFSGFSGASSGDMAETYTKAGAAMKIQISDRLSAAVIFDQPFGADVNYGDADDPFYFAVNSTAVLNTTAITALLKYTSSEYASVYGGLRYQSMDAVASIPFVDNYAVTGEKDSGVGYVLGAAYEKPDIALRVALTYNSAIDHAFDTSETSDTFGTRASTTEVSTPQSVNLEVQSGIAADTLLFGSVRWVDWSDFDISPADYGLLTSGNSLVSYDDDTVTYSIGLGRKFSEMWSGAVTVDYEETLGGFTSNLGPTDGRLSVGLGGSYTNGNVKVSGGISYSWIGEADTTLNDINAASNFEDNTGLGIGFKIGYTL